MSLLCCAAECTCRPACCVRACTTPRSHLVAWRIRREERQRCRHRRRRASTFAPQAQEDTRHPSHTCLAVRTTGVAWKTHQARWMLPRLQAPPFARQIGTTERWLSTLSWVTLKGCEKQEGSFCLRAMRGVATGRPGHPPHAHGRCGTETTSNNQFLENRNMGKRVSTNSAACLHCKVQYVLLYLGGGVWCEVLQWRERELRRRTSSKEHSL